MALLRNALPVFLGLVLGFQACSKAPPPPSLKTRVGADGLPVPVGGAPNPVTPIPNSPKTSLVFELTDINQDAATYTFGSAKFVSKGLKADSIVSTRFLKLSNPALANEAQKKDLAELCRDISLSRSATDIQAVVGSGSSDEPIHIWWRSHYKNSAKKILSDLVTAGQKQIECVLKIEAKDDDKIKPYFLAFDPLPSDAKLAKGSAQIAQAIERGLMLPIPRNIPEADEKNLIAIDAAAEIIVAVEAIDKDSVKISPQANTLSCMVDPSKNPPTVMNAKQVLSSKASIESKGKFTFGLIEPKSVDGRILKACAAITPKGTDLSAEATLDCGTYQAIKTEGLEAGCQWDIELANAKDPTNTVAVRFSLDKVAIKSFDIKLVDAALTNVPKAAKNPVVAKSINFPGYSEAQLKSMEQMFDLWIAVEPKSYDEDVDGYMKTIEVEECDPGVLGYARLRSAELTMCTNSSLRDADLKKANNPLRPIIQLITAAHEIRHAVKWNHDFDVPSGKPCEATAASAVTMHAIAAKCQLDYCLVLKSMAIREYRSELNYSHQNDNRRFQGQCKTWTDELGITL